jgi:hypothetical protein
MARVAGGAATGAIAIVAGEAKAQVTDHDPTDPSGHGRGGGSGITDQDTGPGADPAGRGRGAGPRQGTGVSDSDTGAGADPVGHGRGRGGQQQTGVTDSDSGSLADPPGRGRGSGPRTSIDISEAQRRDRCENNRARLNDLYAQERQPDGWSDLRLQAAERDYEQARNIVAEGESQGAERRSAHFPALQAIAQQYGIPVSSDFLTWENVYVRLGLMISRARSHRAEAAELQRQITAYQNNIIALGCP